MLKLTNSNLSDQTQQHLQKKQGKINIHTNFTAKTKRAKLLWDSKRGDAQKYPNNVGNVAFTEIKNTLLTMCIGVEVCNYCEQNEATDIEHIEPKSFFPEKTFDWQNYLLACRTCNTDYKSDKMYVFDNTNTNNPILLIRDTPPSSTQIAFINPRAENPMDFMKLNLSDFQFYAIHPPNTQAHQKAEKTLEILQLNNRRTLIHNRKHAFDYYKRLLREYVAVKNATTHQQLEQALDGHPPIDNNAPFEPQQQQILTALKQNFKKSEHATVWYEIIRQQHTLSNQIQQHLQQAPELSIS